MDPVSRRTFLFAAAGLVAQPTARRPSRARPGSPCRPTWWCVWMRECRTRGSKPSHSAFRCLPAPCRTCAAFTCWTRRDRRSTRSVRPLESWRIDGHEGSIRSIGVSLRADFSTKRSQAVRVVLNAPLRARTGTLQPVSMQETLIDPTGLQGPRVRAVLPTGPMCASWIVGPQIPAMSSGLYKGYDRFVERSFPDSLQYLDSDVYHHWLFDRPTVYYTQYVRTGEARFLDAAFHAAHFMRTHTVMDGSSDAGYFTLKGVDVKYVYPRAMHIHYLLTGDERALEAGRTMARFCLTHWDPVYRPERYVVPPLGTDPEKDRLFWSPRHQAYGLLGVLHGWEMTGDRVYWDKAREYIDALDAHQRQPPDGHPPDGSFRQNWALYDPERDAARRRNIALDDGDSGGCAVSGLAAHWRRTDSADDRPLVRLSRSERLRARRLPRLLHRRLSRRQERGRGAGTTGAGCGAPQHRVGVDLRDGSVLFAGREIECPLPPAIQSGVCEGPDDRSPIAPCARTTGRFRHPVALSIS